ARRMRARHLAVPRLPQLRYPRYAGCRQDPMSPVSPPPRALHGEILAPGSELPSRLRQASHQVRDYGTHGRIIVKTETIHQGGNTIERQHHTPGVVTLYEFDLPNLDPPRSGDLGGS